MFRFFYIDPVPNIIVTGDFNRDGMDMSAFLANDYKLKKVVPENLATHNQGSSLNGLGKLWMSHLLYLNRTYRHIRPFHDFGQTKIRQECQKNYPNKVDEFITSRDIRNF